MADATLLAPTVHESEWGPIIDGGSSADVTDVPRAAGITPSWTRPIVLHDAPTAKANYGYGGAHRLRQGPAPTRPT